MKKAIPIITAALLIPCLLSGCSGGAATTAAQTPPEGMAAPGGMAQEEPAVSVEVTEISASSITNTLTYSGTAEYVNSYSVVPDVSGKVKAIYFEVGDAVNEGDILFEIDGQDIQDNIQQLNASLATANASVQQQQTNLEQLDGSSKEKQLMTLNTNISSAETALKNAEFSLASAESSLKQAETNMNTANLDYEDAKRLFEVGDISQETLDASKTSYDNSVSAYESAQRGAEQASLSLAQSQEQLENAKKTYDITVNQSMAEEKKSAQNGLNSAIASRNSISVQLEQAQAKLEKLQVKSPVTGIVSQKNIEMGASLSTASASYVIVDDSTVSIKTNVTEQLVGSLNIGDTVSVIIQTLLNEALEAEISSISPITDASGTYPVSVEIDNADGNIKSGMFAEITFDKEKSENAFTVTKDAVLSDENGSYVFMVEANTAKHTPVTTGIDNGQEIEITGGLSEGDTVIVKGQGQVSDGSTVQIIQTEAQ